MSAGSSVGGYVRIKLATVKEDVFAKIYYAPEQDASDVAALACKEFPRWRLDAGQVRLFLVAKAGEEPSEDEIGAARAAQPLALSAAVPSGAWLVAVPTAPASSGGGGGDVDSMLSKMLGLQLAEFEQRRLESTQRRLESTLRAVQVQRWDGPISAMVKLRTTFEHFFVEALAAVKVTGAARLYMIRDERWTARQPLTPESFGVFLEQSQDLSSTLPDIFVFEQTPGNQTSPPGPPQGGGAAGGHGEDMHGGASQGRSTAVQTEFRDEVLYRDGGEAATCVLCRGAPPLEAAHIVARVAELPELHAAGLLGPNVPNNGIMLCIPCHRLHDAYLWCFDPPRGVVVADALLHDEGLGSTWLGRVGVQLSKPDAADAAKAAWWPPPSVWAAEVARFEAAKVQRHIEADKSPFSCGKCRKRFKRASGVTNHKCGKVQHQLFTPVSVRSAGSAGGGGAHAEV